jgi:hypothetical protein
MTRATRLAANVAAASVVLFAVLWLLTTQVSAIRALSPFGDDPWDAIATYAAIFLPFVAGPTWIRSLRHRSPRLPPTTARRIRWGSSVAATIVLVAAATDLVAIAGIGWPADAGSIAGLMSGLAAVAAVASALAIVLVGRAAITAGNAPAEATIELEPDLVDDLLALATDVAGPLRLRRPVEQLSEWIESFLDRSPISPRRHRILFGIALALAAAVAFDIWHVIREGPWAAIWVAVVFGTLVASGILAAYLGTLRPLRLLRPPRDP